MERRKFKTETGLKIRFLLNLPQEKIESKSTKSKKPSVF